MTTLHEVFEKDAGAHQVSKVKQLLDIVVPILDVVRDTFPTYTLHNHVHAENVVRIMEQLLGDRIEDLSPLEAEILILSAYFHDIGMVFTSEEKAFITESDEFKEYLNANPDAYLAYRHAQDEESVAGIIEGFCRNVHADRVTTWIQRMPENLLTWGSVSIATALSIVCKSHNWPTEELKNSFFDDEFLGSCDLRFCAILLRLADILDFDNSRSPNSVYSYLNLADRSTPRRQVSDVEWRKHLNSDGFVFPPKRKPEYELTINAGPDHPAVEGDIREFLTTIEGQLLECGALLRFCSEKWSGMMFPGKINRRGIVSNGYTFGDFRFKLDRTAILDLFMGENLYSEPLVFFRELIQNSIDAVRARCVLEGVELEASGYCIRITDWFDAEGYHWIKIDDDGIGMDLAVVHNYLLTIGSSYYSSQDFQAQLARGAGAGRPHHVPISRFGVGLLSSFMVAGQIELSTRKVALQGQAQAPLRISFNHLADYFVVQAPDNKATPLPDRAGTEEGYRSGSRPGTSIAVKIDPARYSEEIDVRAVTRRYALASRVPLIINDQRYQDEFDRPLGDPDPSEHELQWDLSGMTDLDPSICDTLSEVKLGVIPLNFQLPEAGNRLSGRGYALMLDVSKLHEVVTHLPAERMLMLSPDLVKGIRPEALSLIDKSLPQASIDLTYSSEPMVSVTFFRDTSYQLDGLFSEKPASSQEAELLYKFRALSRIRLEAAISDILSGLGWKVGRSGSLSSWSHGGVRLPSSPEAFALASVELGKAHKRKNGQLLVIGSIWLDDDFRPELNIARDKVLGVPYKLRSAVSLMLRRSLREGLSSTAQKKTEGAAFNTFVENSDMNRGSVTLANILDDPLISSHSGWIHEPLYSERDTDRQLSIKDLLQEVVHGHRILLRKVNAVECGLLEINFVYFTDSEGPVILKARDALSPIDERVKAYSPGIFVPHESDAYLLTASRYKLVAFGNAKEGYRYSPANRNHKLMTWFLAVAPSLRQKAPGLEKDFVEILTPSSYPWVVMTPEAVLARLQACVDRINRVMRSSSYVYSDVIDSEYVQICDPAREEEADSHAED